MTRARLAGFEPWGGSRSSSCALHRRVLHELKAESYMHGGNEQRHVNTPLSGANKPVGGAVPGGSGGAKGTRTSPTLKPGGGARLRELDRHSAQSSGSWGHCCAVDFLNV